jgi:hypothetical protein
VRALRLAAARPLMALLGLPLSAHMAAVIANIAVPLWQRRGKPAFVFAAGVG